MLCSVPPREVFHVLLLLPLAFHQWFQDSAPQKENQNCLHFPSFLHLSLYSAQPGEAIHLLLTPPVFHQCVCFPASAPQKEYRSCLHFPPFLPQLIQPPLNFQRNGLMHLLCLTVVFDRVYYHPSLTCCQVSVPRSAQVPLFCSLAGALLLLLWLLLLPVLLAWDPLFHLIEAV